MIANNQSSWKWFTPRIVLFLPLFVSFFGIFGTLLSGRFASYAPHASPWLRIEKTRVPLENAPEHLCAIFVGDSRVAFSINAAQFGCPAVNVGYPALDIQQYAAIADQILEGRETDRVYISLSMSTFYVPQPLAGHGGPGPYGEEFHEMAFANSFLRMAYIGVRKTLLLYDAVAGHANFEDTWTYQADLGRWIYPSLSERVVIDIAGHEKQVRRIAENYYPIWRPRGVERSLEVLASKYESIGGKIVFVIPPQLPLTTKYESELAPGARKWFDATVMATAARLGAEFIDCLEPPKCNLNERDFADAVHLNAAGAERYTRFLASSMAHKPYFKKDHFSGDRPPYGAAFSRPARDSR